MSKFSITVILVFVCGSMAWAQTANIAGKATLMSDGTTVTDLTTGEVKGVIRGTVDAPIVGTASLISVGTQNPNTKQTIRPVNSLINTPGVISAAAQTSSGGGGLQTIKAPGGSVTGATGGNLINVNSLTPTGSGSGLSRDLNHINTPPVNTNGQVVSPQ